MNSESEVKVTVVCITYKQAPFIAQALDSFLAQKTTFPFQVLIGEDCGNDGSADIIRAYAERYPDIIVPIIRNKNLGAQKNLIDLCQRAGTPYIALCEGDDYWIDSYKLQKQFNLMEAHPEYRACFHNAMVSVETEDGEWFYAQEFSNTPDSSILWPGGHVDFSRDSERQIEDFLVRGFVQTSTMFFRWDSNINFPTWYYEHGVGDYPLWALQVGEGTYAYIDEPCSVYRIWNGGSYYYHSRYELWNATKDDWLSLDQDLLHYFEDQKVRESILASIERRLSGDLAKLFSARCALRGQDGANQIIEQYSNLIQQCYGVDVKALPYCVCRPLLIFWLEHRMHVPIRNRVLCPRLNRVIVKVARRVRSILRSS